MKGINYTDREPQVIGWCAGCGSEVYSDQEYFQDGDQIVHATGFITKITTINGQVPVSCLMSYLSECCLENEVAQLLGMERRKDGNL